MKAPLLVTPGNPRGIGPEVAVRAVRRLGVDAVLVGDVDALRRVDASLPVGGLDGVGLRIWEPEGDRHEPVEVRALRVAVSACRYGGGRALVTGPIHKARLAATGFAFHGHTDFLGHLCGVVDPVMAFVGGTIRVALVTVHLPLRDVADAVTEARILHVLQLADRALRTDLRIPAPRLLVCGLNPHAGDGGVLGSEETTVIAPAVARARDLGIDARGPVSAETAFRDPDAAEMVIAMYHDQGLVPLKRVDFGQTVNWTLGLPIVRTSVDHGTADELVGTGRASPQSMEAALRLALLLTGG